MAASVAIFAFVFGLFSILGLTSLKVLDAVSSLTVGLSCMIAGLWMGLPYAILGAAWRTTSPS